MSISSLSIQAIQLAGHALHSASQAVAAEVQSASVGVVAALASQPFSPEADQAYSQLRSVARMAHELQALEEQLKGIYAQASEMRTTRMTVMAALPSPVNAPRARSYVKHVEPEDAVDKTQAADAAVKPTVVKSRKAVAPAKPAQEAQLENGAKVSKATEPSHMTSNDNKVLGYLKTVLDRRSLVELTQLAIAQGAQIPRGSIGLALLHLIDGAKVIEGRKGAYRLA
jgi:hypothetical protein